MLLQTPPRTIQLIATHYSKVGLATSFLQGSKEEWSLVRRHPSESIFGVQLAGNKPNSLTSVAEVVGREFAGSVDFVDLNCGCPIDLVFRQGSGSARTLVSLSLTMRLSANLYILCRRWTCCA